MPNSPNDYRRAVIVSGLDIYSSIPRNHPDLWIPTPHLEVLLNQELRGVSLAGLALRTRSKVVKEVVCRAMGYPVPKSFKKTQPRFPGQDLDTYTQKSLNLQIWNEELTPTRRYAIIGINSDDTIFKVRILEGHILAKYDTTGTITRKYQARVDPEASGARLISTEDTAELRRFTTTSAIIPRNLNPSEDPMPGTILPISEVFQKLTPIVGRAINDPGRDQERNRGAELHRLVCEALGYSEYSDNGQFPDVRGQLLEIKLQTSPTIDLGMALPNGADELDMTSIPLFVPRHKDVRYAVFCGNIIGSQVEIDRLYVVTGNEFFNKFKRFEGKISNGKIQIPLSSDFFN